MPKKTKPRNCQRCDRKLGRGSTNGYCSKDCKIKALEERLANANATADRRNRKPQCYARIDWEWCMQEWYLKETFDAKRRCCELRHLGFTCSAKSVGVMPIETANGVKMRKVTILTAHFFENDKGEISVPPDPAEIVDGLQAQDN